jgi:hypothetical protein
VDWLGSEASGGLMRCCVVHVLLARLPPARVLQERDRYLDSKSGIVELTCTSEVGGG